MLNWTSVQFLTDEYAMDVTVYILKHICVSMQDVQLCAPQHIYKCLFQFCKKHKCKWLTVIWSEVDSGKLEKEFTMIF